jgi:hypothetical protein
MAIFCFCLGAGGLLNAAALLAMIRSLLPGGAP